MAHFKTHTIAVADFDRIYRSSLIGTICSMMDRKVLFCASNGRELVDEQSAHPADILVVELFLPVITGFEAIKLLKKAHVRGKILAVSATYQPEMLKPLIDIGVDAYCGKGPEVINAAIEKILNNQTFFDSDYYIKWASETDKYLVKERNNKFDVPGLKSVEIKIMQLTCEGKSNKEIGELLSLSKRTIDTYVRDLLLKLNLNTKIELVNYAMHNGLCRLTCQNSEAGYCTCKTLFV
ncbi:MAG: response regulator transcription factor [Chitinophagaceae bacterium]